MPTRLGQNFLRDEKVLEKIIAAADLKADDVVIEVGPGEGILTEKLAGKCKRVTAIEIDNNLVGLLRNKLSNKKNVEIINENVLKINIPELLGSEASKYKVIANLPYYITSPIIRLFLEAEFPPEEMLLMVQKEVAERIVAKPGKMSVLAVSVQYSAHPKMLFEVSRQAFEPIPEVDSAVIKLTYNLQPTTNNQEEAKNFFRVVRAGFSAKRKMLVNNLSNSFHLDKKEIEKKLKKAGINPTARAQELSVQDWKKMAEIFSK
jgi:16S rRNA (adenine1518-N6/adenine1519-N6)-dimethyltransferase